MELKKLLSEHNLQPSSTPGITKELVRDILEIIAKFVLENVGHIKGIAAWKNSCIWAIAMSSQC